MRIVFITAVFIIYSAGLRAQTADEWLKQKETEIKYMVEQASAVNAYSEVIKKGYTLAGEGLCTIFDFKQGDYRLHEAYFISLRNVKQGIRGYSKLSAALELAAAIRKQYKGIETLRQCITAVELDYIEKVYTNLNTGTDRLRGQLDQIINSEDLALSDDERIRRIDAIYDEMLDRYAFSQAFIAEIKMLAASRRKETNEIARLSSLNAK